MTRRPSLPLALLPVLLASGPARAGGLEVTTITPVGSTDRVTQVTVQFSEPMVPLGRMEREPAEVPVEIDCPAPGRYRWLEPATLAFLLDAALPPSTGCTVRVRGAARSLSGSVLAADVSESFETARIALVRSSPASGTLNLPLQPELTLTFNQPVVVASLARLLAFEWEAGSIGVRAEATAAELDLPVDAERSYLVQPLGPLPRDTPFRLRIPTGLESPSGPLPSLQETLLEYRTFVPLRVVRVQCSDHCRPDCDPDSPLQIELSTPVGNREAERLLRVLSGRARPAGEQAGDEGAEPESPAGDDEEGWAFDGETTWLTVPGPWQPRSTARLLVPAGLTDVFGQSLGRDQALTRKVGPRWPIHDLGGRAGVWESKGDRRYPLLSRNVDDATLRARRFPPEEVIPFLRAKGLLQAWDGGRGDSLAGLSGVRSQPLGPWGRKDVSAYRPIDLDALLGSRAEGGLLYLDVSSALVARDWGCDREQGYDKALLQVTDIGLSVKFGSADTLVFTTSLDDALPLAGTSVELRSHDNEVLWQGQTDAAGVAIAPGLDDLARQGPEDGFPELWVFARRDGDFAFVHTDWHRGIEPWAFNLAYRWPGAPAARAHTVTDSPIYRPGDTVRLRTLVRRLTASGLGTPEPGTKLRLVVHDSQGEAVHDRSYALSPYGSVTAELTLGPSAHLGGYRIEATLDGQPVEAGDFQVEEYRPASLKLSVEESAATAAPSGHLPDDCAVFDLAARYYFGGAVPEGEARFTLTASDTWVSWPLLAGYAYGEPYRADGAYREPARSELGRGTLRLDREGRAVHELQLPPVTEPRSITLEAQVEDESRRPVAARASFTLHPADVYLGLRPRDWGVERGLALDIDLLAIGRDGAVAPGVTVEVEILRRVWTTVRKKGVGSFYRHESRVEDSLVDAFTVETWDVPRTLSTRPAAAGTYLIVARARDRTGRAAESTAWFYAWGGDVAGFERYDHDRIDLVPDRESYRPGDTARILVKSPFEDATALVTVERDGVERYETSCLSGSAALLEVPVLAGDAPTVYVSVLLARGRLEERPSPSGADLGKPQVRVGYATLAVHEPDRKLEVAVVPERATYRPRETVAVNLEAKGVAEPAELTVLALDEAVLDVAGRAPWDPFAVFYAPRPLAVRTADTRLQLVGRRHFGQKGEVLGGGGGGESEALRRDFKASAFFAGQVETDAAGRAQIAFSLPDNLTTFRIVALAATRHDRFGSGETSILVTKPVVLAPSIPRFLEVGDRAQVGVVVHNRTGRDGIARVTIEAAGADLKGRSRSTAAVAAGGAHEVLFPVEASGEGTASFRLVAQLNGESDRIELSLPVHDRVPLEVYAAHGTTTADSAEVALLVPADARPDRGGITLSLHSSLAGGLKGPVDWMRRYRYDCLEQRLSRAVAFVAAASYPERIGIPGAELDADRSYPRWVAGELASFQADDGSFAYWPGSPTDPYLTGWAVLVTRFLAERGLAVAPAVRERATEALARTVRQDLWPWWYSPQARRETRAFLLAVLAREGDLEAALLERSVAERAKLSVFALASLLDAAGAVQGKDSEAFVSVRRVLLGRAARTSGEFSFEEVDDDGLAAVLHSPVKGNAMALIALAERAPEWPNVPSLMRWLMTDEKAGGWRTTHEIAWGMLAAWRYLEVFEKDTPSFTVRAALDGRVLAESRFDGFEARPERHQQAMADLPRGRETKLTIARSGEGRLYYDLLLSAASAGDDPVHSGLQVERRYEHVDGRPLEAVRGVARGEQVRVVLTLTAPSLRHFVVLEDPLPAGFEPVNFRLATSAAAERALLGEAADNAWVSFEELRDDRALAYTYRVEPGSHTFTYLARATSPGSFLAPAPHAEEMYAPETYGRGAPARIDVLSAQPVAERQRRSGPDEVLP